MKIAPFTRGQALSRAKKVSRYAAGYCARFTREQYGVPPSGDADRDGDVDAVDSWRRAQLKHPGDRTPPDGVPAYWSGGRKAHGHIAPTETRDGVRGIRGTDSPAAGLIGWVPLAWVEEHWGLTYLGWSEDIHGYVIPTDGKKLRRYLSILAAIRKLRVARDYAKQRGDVDDVTRLNGAINDLKVLRRQLYKGVQK